MVMNHHVDPGNQIQVNYEQSILPLVCFVKAILPYGGFP